ncbi:MAG: alpha/beta fold hydrolase [Thermodesulfobacteriota bacterium]
MSEVQDFFLSMHQARIKVRSMGNPGQGPVLLFLHEALGCIDMWKGFPEELCQATGLPGVAYDRLGHGCSSALPGPMGPRSLDYLEKESRVWLPEIIKTLGLEQVIPIGHSDGGTMALMFAAAKPEQVPCLITEAAHVFVEQVTQEGIRRAVQDYQDTDLKNRLAKYHGDKTEALFRAWSETWLSEEFSSWNMEAELPWITSPALIIQGQDDEFGSPKQVQSIVIQVSGPAWPCILSDCGHIPHLQARQRTLQAMQDFILDKKISN